MKFCANKKQGSRTTVRHLALVIGLASMTLYSESHAKEWLAACNSNPCPDGPVQELKAGAIHGVRVACGTTGVPYAPVSFTVACGNSLVLVNSVGQSNGLHYSPGTYFTVDNGAAPTPDKSAPSGEKLTSYTVQVTNIVCNISSTATTVVGTQGCGNASDPTTM